MKKSTELKVVNKYIKDVVGGKVLASKFVKLACKRHINDLKYAKRKGIYFDEDAARHAIEFFPRFLRHFKGRWAGQPFELTAWQQFIVASIFGWKRKDGLRRFRQAYIEVARKNGKSTLAAGIGLYMLVGDGEPGAEVYAAATKRDQAKIVWNDAKKMVKKSPVLNKHLRIYESSSTITFEAVDSKFEPLGADADTLDGLNVHCAIIDELHAHKSSELWDVIETATGARTQPLMFAITTAGFNRECFCYKQREYVINVLEEAFTDDTTFAYIATLDEKDDWKDSKVYIKANPNLGGSVELKELKTMAKKAQRFASSENSFKCKRLNIWTNQVVRWLKIEDWDACGKQNINEKNYYGQNVYLGLDLSSTTDITALVLWIPQENNKSVIIEKYWVPQENARDREIKDRVPYVEWGKKEYLKLTPGNVIDYEYIKKALIEIFENFNVRGVAFDRWNFEYLRQRLIWEGIDEDVFISFGQGYASMSQPSKEFEADVISHNLIHSRNPVTRWMVNNVAIETDPAGNIKPSKKKSREKIDGIVAAIMAKGLAMVDDTEKTKSVYEERGIMTI